MQWADGLAPPFDPLKFLPGISHNLIALIRRCDEVLKPVGQVAYELELPSSSKVHPVFHVSLLRPAPNQTPCNPPAPLPLSENLELLVYPIKILNHRWTTSNTLELLIQWKDRPIEDATWEDYDKLKAQFPLFQLEEKLHFKGGSNDRVPKPFLTYSRRKKKSD